MIKKEKNERVGERCVQSRRSNSVNSDNPTVHLSKAPSINNQYLMITVIIPTTHNDCNRFYPELLMQVGVQVGALNCTANLKKKKKKKKEEKERENTCVLNMGLSK